MFLFFASTFVDGNWSVSGSGHFRPMKKFASTKFTGGWVDSRVSLGDMKKGKFLTLPGLEHDH
jgi:hypothetical protein